MFFNHFFHIFATFLPILHIFAAFLPAIVILIYVYKQDKFPEPKNIVFKTFIFGCATVLGIDLIIPILDNFSESTFKGEAYYFFDSFIRGRESLCDSRKTSDNPSQGHATCEASQGTDCVR